MDVPARLEWNLDIISQRGGTISYRVTSQGPFTVTLVTAKGYKGLQEGGNPAPEELLVMLDCKGPTQEGSVSVPPGTSHFILENRTDKAVRMHLQCFALPAATPGILSPSGQDWRPDPALLAQLGPEMEIQGYRLRPPKGYQRQQQQTPGGLAYVWTPPDSENRTGAIFSVWVATHPDKKPIDPQEMVAEYFSGIRKNYTDWEQTAFERGQINGLACLRVRWTAENPQQHNVHGVVYCGATGHTAFLVAGGEAVAQESILPLLETAARTLSKP
jgi:hypothetical protein